LTRQGKAEDRGFRTTHWSEISEARSGDPAKRYAALSKVILRYWRPVYCYLRCKGYDIEAAKDLTQSFFQEVVLGRSLIQQAEREKGRFRTLLLRSLDRYTASVQRAELAKHRMPEGGLVYLENIEEIEAADGGERGNPSEAFDYAWASTLLDQVLGEVERECRETGKSIHWELFQARVVAPILNDESALSRAELCETYNLPSRTKVSNMIVTVKRLFDVVLRDHVRCFTAPEDEVDEEIRYLIKILSRSGAR
jgi:hypothetical protein